MESFFLFFLPTESTLGGKSANKFMLKKSQSYFSTDNLYLSQSITAREKYGPLEYCRHRKIQTKRLSKKMF